MTKSLVRDTEPLRPKDLVREYLGYLRDEEMNEATKQEIENITHWFFNFAYWMEGQDLWDPLDGPNDRTFRCRYHIVLSHESPCPFGNRSERNEIEANEARNNL